MKNVGLLIANILLDFNYMSSLRSRLDTGTAIIICGNKTGALINSYTPFFTKLTYDVFDNKYGIYIGRLRLNGGIEVYIDNNLPSNKLIMTYKCSKVINEHDLDLEKYEWQV